MSPEILRVAHGQVRCGRCDTRFNALDSLSEHPEEWAVSSSALPPAAAGAAQASWEGTDIACDGTQGRSPASEVSPLQVADGPSYDGDSADPGAGAHPGGDDATVPPRLRASDLAAGLDPATIREVLLRDDADKSQRRQRLGWAAASAVLVILLAGQWAYLQRGYLYEFPVTRPALHTLCAVLDCALPLERAPDRIDVLQRVVREHPRVAGALLVDLTFISRADRVIAYPIMELRLADVSGNRVAARRFTPGEYLPAGAIPERGLLPEQPVQVTLELMAPRTEVVSFQFEFL